MGIDLKLARKNVGKSLRDFAVCFFTLALGVCIFYMFNSLDAQGELMAFTESRHASLVALTEILSYFSVFVSAVLGFLIVYANGFLIRRRKSELGLYLLLGMEKWKIARILVYETLMVGLAALAVGLGLGVLLSHGMSVVTARLFAVDMTGFHFIFSPSGAIKAVFYFSLIFLISICFSIVSISRLRLIDFFQAARQNQELKLGGPKKTAVLFTGSLLCLGTSYALILENGMLNIGRAFLASILLGSLGTFLFFMSLSGFLLRAVQASPKLYLRNLNMFVLRQINSRINTTYASMTLVCLMLLLAIGTFSTGMGVSMTVSEDLEKATPYGLSLTRVYQEGQTADAILPEIRGCFGPEAYQAAAEVRLYDSGLSYGDLQALAGTDLPFTDMGDLHVDMIALSELNGLRRLMGEAPLELETGRFLLACSNPEFQQFFGSLFQSAKTFALHGKPFALQSGQMIGTPLETGNAMGTIGSFVVRDEDMPQAAVRAGTLNLNFDNPDQAKTFQAGMNQWLETGEPEPFYRSVSREDMAESGVSARAILAFLAVYLGLVFLIACSALLALQQLSEASDNRIRYELLGKIGVENAMVNRAIFLQLFIYFALPMGLAIIHSVVGLKVAGDAVRLVGNLDIWGNLAATAVFILAVYGGYFMATYGGVKSMISPR